MELNKWGIQRKVSTIGGRSRIHFSAEIDGETRKLLKSRNDVVLFLSKNRHIDLKPDQFIFKLDNKPKHDMFEGLKIVESDNVKENAPICHLEKPGSGDSVMGQLGSGDSVIEQPRPGDSVMEHTGSGDSVMEQPRPGDSVMEHTGSGDSVIEQPRSSDVVGHTESYNMCIYSEKRLVSEEIKNLKEQILAAVKTPNFILAQQLKNRLDSLQCEYRKHYEAESKEIDCAEKNQVDADHLETEHALTNQTEAENSEIDPREAELAEGDRREADLTEVDHTETDLTEVVHTDYSNGGRSHMDRNHRG